MSLASLLVLVPLVSPLAQEPSTIPESAAGDYDPEDRQEPIFGGEVVAPGEWGPVVSVVSQKFCTGTLVAPNLVLTAAHCFDPAPAGPVTILFGDSTDAPVLEVVGEAWGAHPDFCLPSECGDEIHDFAWVRLSQGVDIDPILPVTSQDEFDEVMAVGSPTLFVGYGEDEEGTVGVKREVSSEITEFTDNGREFRAGGDGKDSCRGDSGGPALVQTSGGEWRLAGVLSRGGECGGGGIYGVPLPELCWLRDDSGVDLLPEGCSSCDCVMLPGEVEEGCGCSLTQGAPANLGLSRAGADWDSFSGGGSDGRSGLGLLGLLLLAPALLWRRRARG